MYFQALNATDCLMKTKAPIKLPSFMGIHGRDKSDCKNKNKTVDAKPLPKMPTVRKMNRVRHGDCRKSPVFNTYSRDRDISVLIAGSLMALACLFAVYKAQQDTSNDQKTPDYPVLNTTYNRD